MLSIISKIKEWLSGDDGWKAEDGEPGQVVAGKHVTAKGGRGGKGVGGRGGNGGSAKVGGNGIAIGGAGGSVNRK